MDQEPDVIRQNIEETRSSLAQKIETLEQEVIGTVKGATAAVAETVESVKETVASTVENVKDQVESTVETMKGTVTDTVESVKETFDVRTQVCRHPWGMVGGSFAAGLLTGYLLPSSRGTSAAGAVAAPTLSSLAEARTGWRSEERASAPPRHEERPSWQPEAHASAPARREEPSFLASMFQSLQPEIDKFKGLAIGAAAGVVRDLIKSNLPPQLAPRVEELMNDVTTRLGGQPFREPLLDTSSRAQDARKDQNEFVGGVRRS